MSIDALHDLGFKSLFSHPDLVRDLVLGFIDDDWLHSLDYKTLERVNGSYVTDDLRARSDDVVWRVRAGGEWVDLYLLFEFQSSVDKHMALRMMVYTGLLYQDLIKSGQGLPKGRLPPRVRHFRAIWRPLRPPRFIQINNLQSPKQPFLNFLVVPIRDSLVVYFC